MESSKSLAEDHAVLATQFERFFKLMEEHRLKEAWELLDFLWARLAVHIRAEHHQLFPALRALPAGAFTGTDGMPTLNERDEALQTLRKDHDFFMDELTRAVKTLRRLSELPEDAGARKSLEQVRRRVAGVVERLAPHNRLEEQAVYLWPDRALGEKELEALANAMQKDLDNLPPRFHGRKLPG